MALDTAVTRDFWKSKVQANITTSTINKDRIKDKILLMPCTNAQSMYKISVGRVKLTIKLSPAGQFFRAQETLLTLKTIDNKLYSKENSESLKTWRGSASFS